MATATKTLSESLTRDVEVALGILNACASTDFQTHCDHLLKESFSGREHDLASVFLHLTERIGSFNAYKPDPDPWILAAREIPQINRPHMLAPIDEAALASQQRWGRHFLSLTQFGFRPDIPEWTLAAIESRVGSLSAIELIAESAIGQHLGVTSNHYHDDAFGKTGFAFAFSQDGPEELDLVQKLIRNGHFTSRRPLMTYSDLYSAQAYRCAQAVLDAGIPVKPCLFGPHGEHELYPAAAVVARHLWLVDTFGSPSRTPGLPESLKLSFDATVRSVQSLMSSNLPGCNAIDTLAGLQLIRRRRIKQHANKASAPASDADLNQIFQRALSSPKTSDSTLPLALATGELIGQLFKTAIKDDHDVDLKKHQSAWHGKAITELERIQFAGFDIAARADAITAKAIEAALGFRESHALRGEIALMVIDALTHDFDSDSCGPMTLHWLARDGHTRIAQHLFDKGIPATFDHPERGTILMELGNQTSKASSELFQGIVKRHPELATLPARGGYHKGVQPIHLASKRLDSDMIKALLAAGADPNATDDDGQTPLRYLLSKRGGAAAKTSHTVAQMLLDAGADPNLLDKRGRTPAQAAAKTASFTALTMLFAQKPADLLAKGAAASLARSKLKSRTGGRSLIEQIDIQDTLESAQSDAPPPKTTPTKNRL